MWTSAGTNGTTTYTNFDSNGNWGSSTFTPFAQEGTATEFYNFLNSGQTGNFRYWTGGTGDKFTGTITSSGADLYGNPGTMHEIRIKDNGFWNDVWNKTADFFKEHFYAEGTVALKHGFYASVLLKNGFGGTLGEYTEDRMTYSTDNFHHFKESNTNKVEISGAFEYGGGYTYDTENETNQFTIGAYTFGAEITKDNIFVGWAPNINLGIGVGGEAGIKIGFNFPTSGWFNYDKW